MTKVHLTQISTVSNLLHFINLSSNLRGKNYHTLSMRGVAVASKVIEIIL